MTTMNVCEACGHQQPATSSYCSKCGNLMPGLGTGLLPPKFILQGRYIILDKLGQGGMGAVYKAADQRIKGKIWAIKEMSDAAITDPYEKAQAIAAFKQEAQLLARLSHPNIPRVTDFFTENQKHYIVMEFVPGETLEDRVNRQGAPCGEAEVRDWAGQMCEVLAYLHNQTPPIIFRDLKPANIMLTPQGQLKLIDFGIARLFQPGKGKDTRALGTPGYAPPEQFGRGQTDARSDIYSLGVVLHVLLTRHDPATTLFSMPPVRQLNPGVSPKLELIITKATQPASSQRYQSAEEMHQALVGSLPPSPPPPPGPQPAQPPRSALPWATLAGLALCVVLALGLGITVTINLLRPAPTPAVAVVPPTPHAPTRTPTSAATATVASGATPTPTSTEWPTPTQRPTPSIPNSTPTLDPSAYESAITQVVFKYSEVKIEATTYLDPSGLSEVLVDPVLERQKRSVCWLRSEGLHYVYSDRNFDVENMIFEDDRHATLLAQVSEKRVLYRQDGSVYRDYGQETYRAVYQLERTGDNTWYIYCFQALEKDDPVQCTVELTDPNPCSE